MATTLDLELGPGDGLVAVMSDVGVFVVGDGSPAPVLEVVRTAAASTTASTRALARRLAGLLTGDDADAVPAFGALAATDDGLLVFLYGDVDAAVRNADGSRTELSGAAAATWVDRILGDEVIEVVLAPRGAADDVGASPYSIADGTVPGGWVRWRRGLDAAVVDDAVAGSDAEPEPSVADEPLADEPPADEPPAEEAPAEEALDEAAPSDEAAHDVLFAVPSPEPEPEPVADEAPEPAVPLEPVPPVEPVPDASLEPGPGATSAQPELEPELDAEPEGEPEPEVEPEAEVVAEPEPEVETEPEPEEAAPTTVGTLVFDDGTTFDLDGDYVLGREPETDALVQQGAARPIALDDPKMTVSRIHAEIRVVDGEVQLIDRGSTNGSHVLNVRGDGWDRLVPGQRGTIPPGWQGAVGQRTFTFRSASG